MKNNNDVLGGFSAMFESMIPNGGIGSKGVELIDDPNEGKENDTKAMALDDEEPDSQSIPGKEDENDADENTEVVETEEVDEDESAQVTAFFDAVAESIGWEMDSEDEKPKTVDEFVNYLKSTVEQSSTPKYASADVAELDEFVRHGGSISDYIDASSGVDFDNIDLASIESQRYVVSEMLRDKGFSSAQINKKIEKYEDAGLLEDEAADAADLLKVSQAESKKALLTNQKIAHTAAIEEQQTYFNSVVEEIEALADVRGIKIPKEDKPKLMEYIFKVDSDGRTKYQKDYAKSTKNLIESAYFTMKGDALLDQAKRSGETSAAERLKNTLRTNKVSGSKQTINNGSPTPLWSIASNQLLKRPQ